MSDRPDLPKQDEHQSYTMRKAGRLLLMIGSIAIWTIYVAYRIYSGGSMKWNLILLACGIVAVAVIRLRAEWKDPDPDPERTKAIIKEQRLQELLQLYQSDPERAIRQAKYDGIDLQAEIQARKAAGVIMTAAMIGSVAKATFDAFKNNQPPDKTA